MFFNFSTTISLYNLKWQEELDHIGSGDYIILNKIFNLDETLDLGLDNLHLYCYNTTFINSGADIAFFIKDASDVIISGCKFVNFYNALNIISETRDTKIILSKNIFQNNSLAINISNINTSNSCRTILNRNTFIDNQINISYDPSDDLINILPSQEPKQFYDYYNSQQTLVYLFNFSIFVQPENSSAFLNKHYHKAILYPILKKNTTQFFLFVINNGSLFYTPINLNKLYAVYKDDKPLLVHNEPLFLYNLSNLTSLDTVMLDFVMLSDKNYLVLTLSNHDILFLNLDYSTNLNLKDYFVIPASYLSTNNENFYNFINYDFDDDENYELIIIPFFPYSTISDFFITYLDVISAEVITSKISIFSKGALNSVLSRINNRFYFVVGLDQNVNIAIKNFLIEPDKFNTTIHNIINNNFSSCSKVIFSNISLYLCSNSFTLNYGLLYTFYAYPFSLNRLFNCDNTSCHYTELNNEIYFTKNPGTYHINPISNYNFAYLLTSYPINSLYNLYYPQNLNGIIYSLNEFNYLNRIFVFNQSFIPLNNFILNYPFINEDGPLTNYVYNHYIQRCLFPPDEKETIDCLFVNYLFNYSIYPKKFDSFAILFDDIFFHYLNNLTNNSLEKEYYDEQNSPQIINISLEYENALILVDNISIIDNYCINVYDLQGPLDVDYIDIFIYNENLTLISHSLLTNKVIKNNISSFCSSFNLNKSFYKVKICAEAHDKDGFSSKQHCKPLLTLTFNDLPYIIKDYSPLYLDLTFNENKQEYTLNAINKLPINFNIKLPENLPFIGGEYYIIIEPNISLIYNPITNKISFNPKTLIHIDFLKNNYTFDLDPTINLKYNNITDIEFLNSTIDYYINLPFKQLIYKVNTKYFLGVLLLALEPFSYAKIFFNGMALYSHNITLGVEGRGQSLVALRQFILPLYLNANAQLLVDISNQFKKQQTNNYDYNTITLNHTSNNITATINYTKFLSVSSHFEWFFEINLIFLFQKNFSINSYGSYNLPLTSTHFKNIILPSIKEKKEKSNVNYNNLRFINNFDLDKNFVSNFIPNNNLNILPNKILFYDDYLYILYYDHLLNKLRLHIYDLTPSSINLIKSYEILEPNARITSFDFYFVNNTELIILYTSSGMSNYENNSSYSIDSLLWNLLNTIEVNSSFNVFYYNLETKQKKALDFYFNKSIFSQLNLVPYANEFFITLLYDEDSNLETFDYKLLGFMINNTKLRLLKFEIPNYIYQHKLYYYGDTVYLSYLYKGDNKTYLSLNRLDVEKESLLPLYNTNISNILDYDCLFIRDDFHCILSSNPDNLSSLYYLQKNKNISIIFPYPSFNDVVKIIAYNNNFIQFFVRHYDSNENLLLFTLNYNNSYLSSINIENISYYENKFLLLSNIKKHDGFNIDDKILNINNSFFTLTILNNTISLNTNTTLSNYLINYLNKYGYSFEPILTYMAQNSKKNSTIQQNNNNEQDNTENRTKEEYEDNNDDRIKDDNINEINKILRYKISRYNSHDRISKNNEIKKPLLKQFRQITTSDEVISYYEDLLFFITLKSYKEETFLDLVLLCNNSFIYPDQYLLSSNTKQYKTYYISYLIGFSYDLLEDYNLSRCHILLKNNGKFSYLNYGLE